MAEKKRDYFEVLGVSRDDDEETIKRAFRKLSFRDHPDRNPGDAEALARFKEVSEAYQVLSDPAKKRTYQQLAGVALGHGASNALMELCEKTFHVTKEG